MQHSPDTSTTTFFLSLEPPIALETMQYPRPEVNLPEFSSGTVSDTSIQLVPTRKPLSGTKAVLARYPHGVHASIVPLTSSFKFESRSRSAFIPISADRPLQSSAFSQTPHQSSTDKPTFSPLFKKKDSRKRPLHGIGDIKNVDSSFFLASPSSFVRSRELRSHDRTIEENSFPQLSSKNELSVSRFILTRSIKKQKNFLKPRLQKTNIFS